MGKTTVAIETMAPILMRELGERHYCNRKVVGGRGKWRWVYCRQCNLSAIDIAKKIDRAMRAVDRSGESRG